MSRCSRHWRCALTFPTYRAYQSAFGDPGRLDELSPQPLIGLATRLARARRRAAQDHLRDAVGASLIALALLRPRHGHHRVAVKSVQAGQSALLLLLATLHRPPRRR